MRKAIVTFLILSLMFFGLLAWTALKPPPGRPNILLKFLGCAENASNERVAIFAVTNLSDSDIHIAGGWTSLKSEDDSNSWVRVRKPFWLDTILAQGIGTAISIPVPTNQAAWKYAFDVHNDIGLEQEIRYVLTQKGRSRPYIFQSQWIEFAK